MCSRHDIKPIMDHFIQAIESRLCQLHVSGSYVAEQCDMSYDNFKRFLAGQIENPSFSTIIAICQTLDLPIDNIILQHPDYMDGSEDLEIPDPRQLSCRGIKLLNYLLSMEELLSSHSTFEEDLVIPLLSPVGNNSSESMTVDTCNITTIPAKNYYKQYGKRLSFAMQVPTHIFNPTYFYGDLLLIATDRMPLDGEIGIYECEGKYYIRKYCSVPQRSLQPLNHMGSPIFETEFHKYHTCGYILGIYR